MNEGGRFISPIEKGGVFMGLFGFIKGQFIEVIEATDFSKDLMVFQFPVDNHEIKMGAQLTVREGQCAIFVNEGVIADIYGPGRYTLTTENMPVMTKLKSWKYGFDSPFKAEVFFVSTRLFTDQKWGTQKPVLMRDKEFGMIRMSAFGVFAFRVVAPEVFMREIFGTLSSYSTADITGYLRRILVSGLSDTIGESGIAAIDIVNSDDELAAAAKEKLEPAFAPLGLSLQSLVIENISLPEEVEKAIDKRTTMGVLGDMGDYTRYQAAEAIRDFAQNEGGGMAGIGVGLGAGAQVGQVFASAMNANTAPASPVAPAGTTCALCGADVPAGAKFCPACGKNPRPSGRVCPGCGASVPADGKFCPACGKPLACAKCGAPLAGGKFCPSCGEAQE